MGILKALFIILILMFPVAEIGKFQLGGGFSPSLNDILMSVTFFYWLIYHLINKKKIAKSELDKPLIIFILVLVLSLVINIKNLNTISFLISASYLLRFVMYVSIFYIIKDFDKQFRKIIPGLMFVSGTIITVFGYIQFFLYPSLKNLFYLGWDEHLYRMFSSFLDPNFAGTYFVIFFIFLLGITYNFFKKQRIKDAVVISIIDFFVFFAVYLTYSRSALIMLILSTAVFLLIIKKFKLIFISAFLLLMVVFIIPKSFQTEGTNLLRTFSSEQRITSFATGVKILQANPILGVGFDAYRYAQNKYGLTDAKWQTTHSGAGTDNSFLFITVTTGIIGLGAFLYLIFGLFKLSNNYRNKNIYSLILISVLAGLIFNSFFINSLFYVYVLEMIWILSSLTESK
jgi:O-antigen ligase